jgi:hypothetical protein
VARFDADTLRLDLLRSYYEINRRTWPEMSRAAAFLDAFRLWRKVRSADV